MSVLSQNIEYLKKRQPTVNPKDLVHLTTYATTHLQKPTNTATIMGALYVQMMGKKRTRTYFQAVLKGDVLLLTKKVCFASNVRLLLTPTEGAIEYTLGQSQHQKD